jgi:hypothetical protein
MKLPSSLKVKDTVSLFMNTYQYKIVLVCPAANWFRGKNFDFVEQRMTSFEETGNAPVWLKFKDLTDQTYCKKLIKIFKSFENFEIRVEHPLINFYTNTSSQIEALANLDPDCVKYVSIPNKQHPDLKEKAVIVKKLDFDYKIHMGSTRKSYMDFVNWAEGNSKLRLPNRIKRDLSKSRSWGGGHFYVKGDKTLTMVQMFLGSDISKIETVIKA